MKRKHHIRKLMACVLAISVCLAFSLGMAIAIEPTTAGSFNDPTVTVTENTTAVTDSKTGNVTSTTDIERKWVGETVEKKDSTSIKPSGDDTSETVDQSTAKILYDNKISTVEGSEKAQHIDTKNSAGYQLSGSGSANGSQTTTIADETKTETKANETGLKAISTQADPITLELTPNCEKKKADGNVHAWFTPTAEIVPMWVGLIADGSIAWNASSSSKDGNTVTNITVNGKTDEEGKVTYTREVISPINSTKEIYAYTLDSHCHIIEYTQESYATVTLSTAAEVPALSEIHTNSGYSSTSFELPKKPEIEAGQTPVYEEETGTIISGQVIGELHNDAGKHVGYVRITYAGGKEVKYEAFMGGEVTTANSRETLTNGLKKDTVTKTTHTETKGSVVNKSVSDGTRTASASMSGITGTVVDNYDKFSTYKPIWDENTIYENKDLAPHSPQPDPSDSTEGKFSWAKGDGGYGLGSNFRVKTVKNSLNGRLGAHQFILKSGTSKYYVYCADLAVEPKEGAKYNLSRLEDADYYKNSGVKGMDLSAIRNQIRAIVLSGYWGTDAGSDEQNPNPGSLAAFKKMLINSGKFTATEVNSVTDGMALTATQCAIWYYGNSNGTSDTVSDTDVVGAYKKSLAADYTTVSDDTAALINKIYAYLINKNQDKNGLPPKKSTADNTPLAQEDFAKSVTLTVRENTDDGKYVTDIDITMTQITSGDLKLTVEAVDITDPTKIETFPEYKLSKTNYINNAYHLEGLKLPKNANIVLSFSGTHTIENGVYLFNSYKTGTTTIASQTFIGAGELEQEINLSTSFTFDVSDPVFTLSSTNTTSSADTLEWDSSYTIKHVSTSKPSGEKPDTPKDDDKQEDKKSEDNKGSDDDKPDDDGTIGGGESGNGGNNGNGNGNRNNNIKGGNVGTISGNVDVPKTGDINATLLRWFALTGTSLAALLALMHRRRKQNDSGKA